jgi:hypothetical protein
MIALTFKGENSHEFFVGVKIYFTYTILWYIETFMSDAT